ncbi:MAG: PilN domain-containing protein [Aeromonadaceae bacterium]
MKLRINLYSDEFRPQKRYLALPQLLLYWLLAGLLLLGCGGYLQWLLAQQQQITEHLASSVTIQNQEAERLAQELAARRPDMALQRKVADARSDLEAKQALLDNLAGRQPLKSQGFAMVLEDLARLQGVGIALQRIQLKDERIFLQGMARRSQDVPAWVSQFNGTQALSGRRFDELLMSRDSSGHLVFQLNGHALVQERN